MKSDVFKYKKPRMSEKKIRFDILYTSRIFQSTTLVICSIFSFSVTKYWSIKLLTTGGKNRTRKSEK